MKHELFSNMQKQLTPSPEVRAALSETLAQSAKKRSIPWKKYTALAACAALMIGTFSVYHLSQDREKWLLITKNFRHDDLVQQLHSYVTVEGADSYVQFDAENTTTEIGGVDTGSGGDDVSGIEILPAPNTGVLDDPIQDAHAQEEAINAYQKLLPYVRSHPDWYGGAYIDDTNTLIVCLVESEDPGDKSIELQVLDWTGNGKVGFTSGKYSLAYLLDLQKKVCDALYDMGLDFGCGTDEELNRLDLTLSEATEAALALLAELDPKDDAIYVQVGRLASFVGASSEDPAVHHVMPGGVLPDDEDLIADEPVYDGAYYEIENLPEQLPEQKQPAFEVKGNSSTPAYDPDTDFSHPQS